MRINGILRATSATLVLALFLSPAAAQLASGPPGAAPANGAAPAPPAPAPARIIQHIVISGTQRVEPDTVLTYINLREGDVYEPAQIDQAFKALLATGLFSSATRLDFNPATSTLTIRVSENPIVNQVVFEGNSKASDKNLTKELQVKQRSVFTRAKVLADVARIIEVYRKLGKFAARVDPQIIQRPQNRVDVIYSIKEGPTTGISRINFIGNKVYGADTLKGQILTEESRWWKFLASQDNFDQDRLEFDKVQLGRFYTNHGYADFRVISAVAQLSPDRSGFYLTFTVDEGPKYTFGNIVINSKIKDLDPKVLRPLIDAKTGDTYDAEKVKNAIDALTDAAGNKGFAFAQVHPHPARSHEHGQNNVDLVFDIDQGPRVYIEKINITGNSKTLDKVIRREFRLQEGDAFNQVMVDRSHTRIRNLGFFSAVSIKPTPGSQPDRTDLTVAVTEQSTGSVQLSLGYSSVSQLVGQLSYTQTNLFGRGEGLNAGIEISQISKQYNLGFTEPYFLDRPLVAGISLVKASVNYQQQTYASDTSAVSLTLGFPISEYSTVGLRYSYQIVDITPFSNAPLEIQLAAGQTYGSTFGFSYGYSDLDVADKPTTGVAFSFSQDFAGFGGNLKYIRTAGNFATYTPLFDGAVVGSLTAEAGYITGYDGTPVPIQQRFFKGAQSFRGFSLAGVGPRDLDAATNTGALGGDVYAIGHLQARFPNLLPPSYGIELALFSDFGTVGHIDNVIRTCTQLSCVKDNLAFRASAGVSIRWNSPVIGLVQIDLGLPIVKAPYDRPQIINFNGAAGAQ